MALEKLVALLDDQDEIETACAEFHAIDNSADELSSQVLDLINNNVEVHSSSQADYTLNCWDNTWQNAIAKLTAIRNTLQNEDTIGSLVYKHLSTHPETLDPIQEIEHLPYLGNRSSPRKDIERSFSPSIG